MKVFKAPESTANAYGTFIFLAGSIEEGLAEKWQDRAISLIESVEKIQKEEYAGLTEYNIFNPRRDNWDNIMDQDFKNPRFFQQVAWEMHNLDKAHAVLFYFDPNTKSPISLLELGYHANSRRSGRSVVVCPEGFWKKGNVDFICNLHNIRQEDTLEKAVEFITR